MRRTCCSFLATENYQIVVVNCLLPISFFVIPDRYVVLLVVSLMVTSSRPSAWTTTPAMAGACEVGANQSCKFFIGFVENFVCQQLVVFCTCVWYQNVFALSWSQMPTSHRSKKEFIRADGFPYWRGARWAAIKIACSRNSFLKRLIGADTNHQGGGGVPNGHWSKLTIVSRAPWK